MEPIVPPRSKPGRRKLSWRVVSSLLIMPITLILLPWDLYFVFAFLAALPKASTWNPGQLIGAFFSLLGLFGVSTWGLMALWASVLLGVRRLAERVGPFLFTLGGLLTGLALVSWIMASIVQDFGKKRSDAVVQIFILGLVGGPFIVGLVALLGLLRAWLRLRNVVETIKEEEVG